MIRCEILAVTGTRTQRSYAQDVRDELEFAAIPRPYHRAGARQPLGLFIVVGTARRLFGFVLNQSVRPRNPHCIRFSAATQIKRHGHAIVDFLLIQRSSLHLYLSAVRQLQVLDAVQRNGDGLRTRSGGTGEAPITARCGSRFEPSMPVQQRPGRRHNIDPAIVIDVVGAQPFRACGKLRQIYRFELPGELVLVHHPGMIPIADHQIECLAVGLPAVQHPIQRMAGRERKIGGMVRESGRTLITQKHRFVAQQQQIQIVVMIVIEPDRFLESSRR